MYDDMPDQRGHLSLLRALYHRHPIREDIPGTIASIKDISRAQRVFQGQKEAKLTVETEQGRETFPAGSFVVPVHQAKAALVFYLLEPQSDDGLATWNYFDEELDKAGKDGSPVHFPVYRLARIPNGPREIVKK